MKLIHSAMIAAVLGIAGITFAAGTATNASDNCKCESCSCTSCECSSCCCKCSDC